MQQPDGFAVSGSGATERAPSSAAGTGVSVKRGGRPSVAGGAGHGRLPSRQRHALFPDRNPQVSAGGVHAFGWNEFGVSSPLSSIPASAHLRGLARNGGYGNRLRHRGPDRARRDEPHVERVARHPAAGAAHELRDLHRWYAPDDKGSSGGTRGRSLNRLDRVAQMLGETLSEIRGERRKGQPG